MPRDSSGKVKLEEALDHLYAAAPEDFVRLRNEQAKALTREAAAELSRHRRPTVVAWALNQLSRQEPKQVAELLAAGKDLTKAHRRLLSGVKSHGLQEAMARRRRATHALEAAAVKLLEESGRSADSHRAGLTSTLQAASLDAECAELLRQGRLTRELAPPSGFGAVGGLSLMPKAARR